MVGHLKGYMAMLAFLLSLLVGVVLHARTVGKIEEERLRAALQRIFPVLMSADPGINNSARYIRHFSLSYPGTSFPDFPAQPDYLPAGMVWPPPDFSGVQTAVEIREDK